MIRPLVAPVRRNGSSPFDMTTPGTRDRFNLTRTASVARPVREDGLTLEQAEELLNEWKLRGFHGG